MKRCMVFLTAAIMLTGCGADGSSAEKSTTKADSSDAKSTSTTATPSETTPSETTVAEAATTTSAPAETEAVTTTNDKGQTEFEVWNEKISSFIKTEKVNGICVGTTFDEVKKLFGEPDKLNKEDFDHGDGILQHCYYDKLESEAEDERREYGVEIVLERLDGVQRVREFAFHVSAETTSGIQIGSPRSAVIAAYKDKGLAPYLDLIPNEKWETVTLTDPYPLTIGHWKWGGMSFEFDEKDNVSSIRVCSGTSI